MVVGAEREVEDVEVLPDAHRRHRLRNHHIAQLQLPADDHLRGCFAVPGADRVEGLVADRPTAGQRRPGLGEDAVGRVVRAHGGLLQPRVQLHLVDDRDDIRFGEQTLQVVRVEIRHPDRARAT